MERHEPPPSLWPIGFAVGVVCLLVGLIVSWVAAAVGAVTLVVCGALWARDVARGASAPAGPAPAADEGEPAPQAPAVPAHKGEAAMPEPAPGERFPRSVFLESATLGLGAIIGGGGTLPGVGFALLPAVVEQHSHPLDPRPIHKLPQGQDQVATLLPGP